MTAPPNMTADEVAALLGLGRQTVYDGCSRGEIPHLRVGRRIVFCREVVLAWFRGQTLPDTNGG